ncbi:hypothetical protein [Streptomyces sp. ID05-18]|uniref:hypothetical protein n=1 Tax=Streptomyces sp. ID05-18 TaxID=3028662 RepID=UPI0029B9AF32|nr:hypothetical protein [Streptomyces sp. ID05-18]MDX3490941.1 hypothetical protein [Streptomyces sp. ID05-18]
MARELTLICGTCKRAVVRDDGYLWVSRREADSVRKAYRALEHRRTDPRDGSMSFGLADICGLPAPAVWRADHHGCDFTPENDAHYRIPADRLRLRADLLDWTAHLTGKIWLPHTDWRDLLRETRTGSTRLAVSDPRPPAYPAAF